MQVRKRNGNIVDYDREFIVRAVTLAAAAAGEHDMDVEAVVDGVEKALAKRNERVVDIETIQDGGKNRSLSRTISPTAKAYILYRVDKEKDARPAWNGRRGLLTREFLSPYKARRQPHGRAGLVCLFAHLFALYPRAQPPRVLVGNGAPRRGVQLLLAPTTREEAEKLYDNIFPPAPVPLRRTLWVGATPVSRPTPCPTTTAPLRSSTISTPSTICSIF